MEHHPFIYVYYRYIKNISSYLPVLFVYETESTSDNGDTEYHVHGMIMSMLVQFILCMLPLIVAYFYFESEPPTAPSLSQGRKNHQKTSGAGATLENSHQGGANSDMNERLLYRGGTVTSVTYDPIATSDSSESSEGFGSQIDQADGKDTSPQYRDINRGAHGFQASSSSSVSSSSAAAAAATTTVTSSSAMQQASSSSLGGVSSWKSVLEDTKTLFKDANYFLLFCSFSIGSGRVRVRARTFSSYIDCTDLIYMYTKCILSSHA